MDASTNIRDACHTSTAGLPQQRPHPRRSSAPSPQRAGVPDAPPPKVPNDSSGDTDGCGTGTAHDEVHAYEHVWEVDDREGDQPKEGRLGSCWCEPRGDVGEREEKSPRVHERAQRNV